MDASRQRISAEIFFLSRSGVQSVDGIDTLGFVGSSQRDPMALMAAELCTATRSSTNLKEFANGLLGFDTYSEWKKAKI